LKLVEDEWLSFNSVPDRRLAECEKYRSPDTAQQGVRLGGTVATARI
jgi:hypothetical protein